jgi:hypothetical protein
VAFSVHGWQAQQLHGSVWVAKLVVDLKVQLGWTKIELEVVAWAQHRWVVVTGDNIGRCSQLGSEDSQDNGDIGRKMLEADRSTELYTESAGTWSQQLRRGVTLRFGFSCKGQEA